MEKNYRDRVTEIHVDQLIKRCQKYFTDTTIPGQYT